MSHSYADAARHVLDLIDRPYVRLSVYEDPGPRAPWKGYAAVLMEAKASVENWCHPVVEGAPPWHRTEADAWECFDLHHPGLRNAIEVIEAAHRPRSESDG